MKRRLISTIFAILLCAGGYASPRYIFFFIGDGMGLGHIMATENYRRMVLGKREPMIMLTMPHAGIMTTYSASSPVTDSAAAGTALACGQKTSNRVIGINHDGDTLMSIAGVLHRKGYGVGLVTSVAPDDATPAAFYAHVKDRSMFDDIASDAIESGYEFIAGANLRGETSNYERFRSAGIAVASGAEECRDAGSRRVLLLNTDSVMLNDIGYALDSVKSSMNLPEMTRLCMDHLLKHSSDRFFMMVEGGSIDHAAHSNDGASVIKEIISFDQALRHAYDFYLAHPDETAIIVTSDHDTGGMATVSNGGSLETVDMQKMSKDRLNDRIKSRIASGQRISWDEMADLLTEQFDIGSGIKMTADEEERLRQSFARSFGREASSQHLTTYSSYSEFIDVLFDVLNAHMSIKWITDDHTANPVGVFAVGKGTEKLGCTIDNTEIYDWLMDSIIRDVRL